MTKIRKYFDQYFRYIKPFLLLSVVGMVLASLISLTEAAPMWLAQYLIDNVLIEKDITMLMMISVALFGIMFIKGLGLYYRVYVESYISGNIIKNIRTDLYENLLAQSHEFFAAAKTGDVMTRFNSDIPKTRMVIQNCFRIITQVLTILVLLIRLITLNYKLAIICFVVIPFSGWIIKKYVKRLRKTGKEIQESLGRFNNILQEAITGINVIKSFANEKFEMEKFQHENQKNFKVNFKKKKIDARIRPIVEFFNTLVMVAMIYYGGSLVVSGKMSAGELMAFLTGLGLIYNPIIQLTKLNNNLQSDMAALDRVYEILNLKSNLVEKDDARIMKSVTGEVSFEAVDFSYNDNEETIKNFNLSVNPGEMIALVGKSGSGKSTLVRLIPRFYDINSGKISIDGVDIKDLKFESLRKNIGIVPQDTFLFSGTVKENLKYGKQHASDDEVMNAAKQANAYEFIKELPEGFETEIGERGVRLSGGQKQRLAIARAILEDPKILILDEATSALDTESEKIVQEALDRLMEQRTSFVIAHRLSTILHADRIIVMEDGELKECGTNEELLALNGIYKKLYDTQFKVAENGEG